MEPKATLILHHGGHFIAADDDLDYVGGEFCVWEDICTDYINRFMLDDLVKSCALYFKISHIWCLDSELGFKTGLFEVVSDTDVVGIVNIAIRSNNEVHLYYEHDVDDPVIEAPVALLTGGEEGVGETEKEDIQDHHVPEENGEDQPSASYVAEEIPDLNATTNDHMSGDDDSKDSMYLPSNTHTEDDEYDAEDDYEPEEGYDHEFDYYDAAVEDENDVDEPEDMEEVAEKDFNVPMAENYANVHVDVASENDEVNSYHSEALKSPISSDGEGNGRDVFPQFNPNAQFGQVHLEIGMEFDKLMTFKNAVKDYNIFYGRNIKWAKNDKERARAKCAQADCRWEIYCSWSKVNQSFQVKTYYPDHTCCRGFKNKQATRKWVVNKLQHQIKIQPSITYSECFDYMKREFGILVNDSKLFRAIKEARELVEGSLREQYGRIWDYSHEILRSNPRSSCLIDVIPIPNAPPQFQRIYICLEACKLGFKAGCRPFIGLDGCFLKGYYGGQLLAAVGQDANNQIFVIAYAIVDVENKDNWKWFLTLLHTDLGDFKEHGWNFMSDMQKVRSYCIYCFDFLS